MTSRDLTYLSHRERKVAVTYLVSKWQTVICWTKARNSVSVAKVHISNAEAKESSLLVRILL